MWASIKKGLRPRAGYKHTAKKGSGKLLEKFLYGGALVGGAIATGEIVSAVRGGNDPGQVESQVYVRDSSSNLMKFSGFEGGSLSGGSILMIAILAVIGFIVCIPITRCLRRCWKCGKKGKKEQTFVLPGSFNYRQQAVPQGIQATHAIDGPPQENPEAFPAPPVFAHQVKNSALQFPSPASAPTAWDQEDISEDPIVTGMCSGFYGDEIQPAPPAMEDIMESLEKREVETVDLEEEEDEFRTLGKRNNLGERLRVIKKRALERVGRE